jgi:hypothetical protein
LIAKREVVADIYNDDWITSEFERIGYPAKIIEKERKISRLQRENFPMAFVMRTAPWW